MKLKSIGSRIPFTTEPSITSHFTGILFCVFLFEILSLVYTTGESAWIALVGLQSQYGVKPNKVLKKSFHQILTFQKYYQNELK